MSPARLIDDHRGEIQILRTGSTCTILAVQYITALGQLAPPPPQIGDRLDHPPHRFRGGGRGRGVILFPAANIPLVLHSVQPYVVVLLFARAAAASVRPALESLGPQYTVHMNCRPRQNTPLLSSNRRGRRMLHAFPSFELHVVVSRRLSK